MRIFKLSGRSCYLDLTPNSLTKLQGNVLNLEGRIMDQILAVKGLIKYPGDFFNTHMFEY